MITTKTSDQPKTNMLDVMRNYYGIFSVFFFGLEFSWSIVGMIIYGNYSNQSTLCDVDIDRFVLAYSILEFVTLIFTFIEQGFFDKDQNFFTYSHYVVSSVLYITACVLLGESNPIYVCHSNFYMYIYIHVITVPTIFASIISAVFIKMKLDERASIDTHESPVVR